MVAPEVHREIERKLEVPDGFIVPDLVAAGVVSRMTPCPTLSLVAVYFDTPDLLLARQRITLRRRTGGIDDGWHLKVPSPEGDDDSRDEVHVPADDAPTPPSTLLAMVRHVVGHHEVTPVAIVRNQRHRFDLVGFDGRALGELTDDHVEARRTDGTEVSFRELEVEAASLRTLVDIEPVVAALIAAGATASSFTSKALRAFGPLAAPT